MALSHSSPLSAETSFKRLKKARQLPRLNSSCKRRRLCVCLLRTRKPSESQENNKKTQCKTVKLTIVLLYIE